MLIDKRCFYRILSTNFCKKKKFQRASLRWLIDDISDVPRLFGKKDEPLLFPTVISSANVFPTVITIGEVFLTFTSGNTFLLVITIENTFPLLITVRKNNGLYFFLKKRGTSEMSSMGHRTS